MDFREICKSFSFINKVEGKGEFLLLMKLNCRLYFSGIHIFVCIHRMKIIVESGPSNVVSWVTWNLYFIINLIKTLSLPIQVECVYILCFVI